MTRRIAAAVVAVWAVAACEGGGGRAGAPDVGTADAAVRVDGGSADAEGVDAGAVDAAVDAGPAPRPYPAPGDWTPNRGPGGPAVTFEPEALYVNCAWLDGGEGDVTDHHNLATMYDGYLLLPWAPEFGLNGGLSFYDISDPCNPVRVGYGYSPRMRETHSVGFSQEGGRWAVVNQIDRWVRGGIQFWDLSDVTAPAVVSNLNLEGFLYPDAYARVVLSVFWQVPYVYAAGADNGVYVIDASDPRAPALAGRYVFEPVLRAGQVQAIGNLLVVTAAEGTRTVLLDISDPVRPQPIPGGDFVVRDAEGEPREAYFSNFEGGFVWYARKDAGGGVIVYDVRDPSRPTYAGGYRSDGNGGYIFLKERLAFVGESRFAAIYDARDLTAIAPVARFELPGDLDTITPIGNVVVLSVDDEAEADRGSAIAPWREQPDRAPPRPTWSWPPDGAADLPPTSAVGVTFDEFVDVRSAWEGSVRLYETGTDPALTRVDGFVSAQENIVNFRPRAPLKPATRYTLEIPAGGVADFDGNRIAETFTVRFTTAGR